MVKRGRPRVPARKIAIANGDKFYIGNPCMHGHVAPRRVVNGTCVQCAKLSAAKWRRKKGILIQTKAPKVQRIPKTFEETKIEARVQHLKLFSCVAIKGRQNPISKEEAIEKNIARYNGRTCKFCGSNVRYVNWDICINCVNYKRVKRRATETNEQKQKRRRKWNKYMETKRKDPKYKAWRKVYMKKYHAKVKQVHQNG